MSDPTYPDTPWWSNLLAVLLTAIVSVLGTLYAMRPKAPGGPTTTPVILSFFKDTLTYIPHILLLFGVLADMFTYQGVYSIPSLVGLLSIPLNWVMKYFWTGIVGVVGQLSSIAQTGPAPPTLPRMAGGATPGEFFRNYDGCNVQGFDGLGSPYAPQTLVVTATIFSYYIFDLIQNRGLLNSTAAIAMFAVIYVAETLVIGSCRSSSTRGGAATWTPWSSTNSLPSLVTSDPEPSTFLKSIAALAEGMLFGGVGYATVQYIDPSRLPSSAISPFPKMSRKDLKGGPGGTLTDKDGNPYVCMPNGQCYPDMSTDKSRKAFAEIAAKSLGTGSPAVPSSCSASTKK